MIEKADNANRYPKKELNESYSADATPCGQIRGEKIGYTTLEKDALQKQDYVLKMK